MVYVSASASSFFLVFRLCILLLSLVGLCSVDVTTVCIFPPSSLLRSRWLSPPLFGAYRVVLLLLNRSASMSPTIFFLLILLQSFSLSHLVKIIRFSPDTTVHSLTPQICVFRDSPHFFSYIILVFLPHYITLLVIILSLWSHVSFSKLNPLVGTSPTLLLDPQSIFYTLTEPSSSLLLLYPHPYCMLSSLTAVTYISPPSL